MPHPADDHQPQLEEIVAYLDGELSPEESADVEQRLASDEGYRQQLQSVERAWAALDDLPPVTVDDRFSRTTMELAVQIAAEVVQEQTTALPIIRRKRRLSTVMAAVAVAALGCLVCRLAWRNPNAELLVDLPVIDNVDMYSQFEDVGFLRSLRREFGGELDLLGGHAGDLGARIERFETVNSPPRREGWLRELDDRERTDLRTRLNRFQELPQSERERLRKLHENITFAPDADALQEAMLAFDQWLRGLSPAQQFELRRMPSAERARTVRELATRMRDDELFALSDDELRAFVRKIRSELDALMRFKAQAMLRNGGLQPGGRNAQRRPTNLGQVRAALAGQFAAEVGRPGEFQTAVIEALPERVSAPFEKLPPRDKVERVMTWMRQAEALRGAIPQQELERFFAEELDAATRAELLSLPPAEMQQAISRRYRGQPEWRFGNARSWSPRHEGDQRGPRGEGDFRGPDRRPPPIGFGPPRSLVPGDQRHDFRPEGDHRGPGPRPHGTEGSPPRPGGDLRLPPRPDDRPFPADSEPLPP